MRRRPPDISFTRLTYSCAMSLKMSAEPQEPCILMTIGACDLTIVGKPSVAAPAVAAAAPVRNFRREAAGLSFWLLIYCLLLGSLLWRGIEVPVEKPNDSTPALARPARPLHDVKRRRRAAA